MATSHTDEELNRCYHTTFLGEHGSAWEELDDDCRAFVVTVTQQLLEEHDIVQGSYEERPLLL